MLKWICFLVFILSLLHLSPACAEWIELEWNPNSESNLAGYHIYQSSIGGGPYEEIADIPVGTEHCIVGEVNGIHYWVATAYDSEGQESDYSNEVSNGIHSAGDTGCFLQQLVWNVHEFITYPL